MNCREQSSEKSYVSWNLGVFPRFKGVDVDSYSSSITTPYENQVYYFVDGDASPIFSHYVALELSSSYHSSSL